MPAPSTQRDFALAVLTQLRDAGHEALWAGGCVRDQLLGRTPKDYDVATNARPETVRELFGKRRTLAIGASFGVISVLGAKPLAPIEVATFRSDGAYVDGRRPTSVEFTTAEEDAQRRDFTINGLFYDPLADQVVDYVGGVADLRAGIVRAIGDPRRRFEEDKLRLLRAVRFSATYGFTLERETFAAVREMAPRVTSVSGERIGAELRRMLVHRTRGHSVSLLIETGLLRAIAPELADRAGEDAAAWSASLDRLGRLVEDAEFSAALSAMLFGLASEADARALGRRVRLSNRDTERTAWILRHLPTISRAAELPWPRLQRVLADEGRNALLAVAAAELPPDHAGLVRCRAALAQPSDAWNPPPLVTGDDLLAAGLKPGRRFAELLNHLRDKQLDGELTTPAAAIAAARAWLDLNP
jgi:poly(A) polymerase